MQPMMENEINHHVESKQTWKLDDHKTWDEEIQSVLKFDHHKR